MADKVQLIKEEIERRIKNLSYLILNIGNTEDLTKEEYCHCVEQETLKSLLIFINSFQEYPSPKFKIGNTIRDKEGKTGAFTITDIKVEDKSLVYLGNKRQKVSIWCQDDYEIVNNDLLVKENPASDDLEEEIKRYINEDVIVTNEDVVISKHHEFHNFYVENLAEVARHFAEWQKQKDLEDIFKSDMTMPNKFYEKGKADAMKEMKETLQTEYEKGRFDAMQAFLEKACEWLNENQDIYFGTSCIYRKELFEDFKKHMQDEM